MTTIIRLGWEGPSTCSPDPASFRNLRSRETSSTPRSWVFGRLKNVRWLPTRNTNSSPPCAWTSPPKYSTSSTASLQLRLWGSFPLRRFSYSDSRCLLIARSPSQKQFSKLELHASRTAAIRPEVKGVKQLDDGIEDTFVR